MTAISQASETSTGLGETGRSNAIILAAIWLSAVVIAVFLALIRRDSAVFDGFYIPRANDSFYHARRILDAAVGERGFYQFDARLHVPEGTWIPWPWAYDYLMAKVVQAGLWLSPSTDPMAIMAYVPVVWILVNATLFLAACGAAGLSYMMRALAMLAFALSPLTQLLHGVAMVDHHYVEHTFVLLNLWLGMSWLKRPNERRWAIALGAALGIAPAFHNGLFLLQLVSLGCLFVLWIRDAVPPFKTVAAFAVSLLAGTQLVLLPSEPYRNWMFEFGLLSWFHFYVACCTALVVLFLGWRRYSVTRLGQLAVLASLLALPIGAQLIRGATFLSTDISILAAIVEARSPYELFTETYGPLETASYYSWLILLAPAVLLYYSYRVFVERRPNRIFFAVGAVFGLALLLTQFRFHYYGLFALIAGTLLILDELRKRYSWHAGLVFVVCFAALVLAYQPALRERLFIVYAPGSSPEYAAAIPIFLDLSEACAEDPGVVLASNDDGSAILFHTECSVIANNFILRPADERKIAEIDELMRLPPQQIRSTRPDIKYLLVRAKDFSTEVDGVETLSERSAIARDLFLAEQPSAGFTLIRSIRRAYEEGAGSFPYARLFKISHETDSGP
jgi:hypothetical protein